MCTEFLVCPHPEEPERSEGVSKDEAAPWFEAPGYARLLTMRPIEQLLSTSRAAGKPRLFAASRPNDSVALTRKSRKSNGELESI
jgi:hypothetical protein